MSGYDRSCNKCKHADKSYKEQPCITCKYSKNHNNFEPKEKKDDTK